MRALITGITGFAGNHLSDLLLRNNFEVYGIGTSDLFGNNKARYYKIDILDAYRLKQKIKEIKPEFIFHLAGISSVKRCYDDPFLCDKINITGTKNLLDSVRILNLNTKILVAGSAEVYGVPKSLPIQESAELSPRNPYALSKKKQEDLCKGYMSKLQIIISRSFSHIGPGQEPVFVASDFAKQIAEIENGKEPVIKVGNLEAKRDFTDVRDIVRAYHLALQKGIPGECYNICSGEAYSIKKILNVLLSFSDVEIRAEQDSNKLRPTDIPVQLGDNTKFCKKTGWRPLIPLKKTLKDLIDYWREKINKSSVF